MCFPIFDDCLKFAAMSKNWIVVLSFFSIAVFSQNLKAVSYTHLDVYKRQPKASPLIVIAFLVLIASKKS